MRRFVTACRDWQLRPLVRSMQRHCGSFGLHVLAWDWAPRGNPFAKEIPAAAGSYVEMVQREDFLARHPGLLPLPGEPRSPTDTVCSVRWTFGLDVMRDYGDAVTMIDGDLFFFGSPEPVFTEIGDAPMAVSPHGFAPAAEGLPGVKLESHRAFGAYNGGWCYFAAPAPLEAMAELCRGWCRTAFLRLPSGRQVFGDQGWLERVAEEFGAHVIRHPGLNIGPWNVNRYPLRGYDGPQDPIAYHYSSLRWNQDGSLAQLFNPEYAVTVEQQRRFYDPYLAEVNDARPR